MRYEGKLCRPPSEHDASILQATIGCSHNLCGVTQVLKRVLPVLVLVFLGLTAKAHAQTPSGGSGEEDAPAPEESGGQDQGDDTSGWFTRGWISLEAGPIWQSRNVVARPAESGTKISLSDIDSGPFFGGRLYAGITLFERHDLRLLVAPLSVTLKGDLPRDSVYEGQTLDASKPVEARYTFNSYRLTYRYRFFKSENWDLRGGLTGKIRDAEIRISQDGLPEPETSPGFVPLLHFAARYSITDSLRILLDIDALAAPQGRAEDVALLVEYTFWRSLSLASGYRTVEGGSDSGGDTYTFAWLHYWVFALSWNR